MEERSFRRRYKKQDSSILVMIQCLPEVYFMILGNSFIDVLAVNII